ncbi:MAG: hypothetical protein U5K75_12095 [Ahrensia sp.]|nr:hypothetical protein [Ahrensia sp.]
MDKKRKSIGLILYGDATGMPAEERDKYAYLVASIFGSAYAQAAALPGLIILCGGEVVLLITMPFLQKAKKWFGFGVIFFTSQLLERVAL